MVYEDDLERIAHEEAVHYHIIGFSSCVRCISMDEDPSVRAIFDIDVEDWLQARAFGLTVITVRRNA